MFADFCFSLIAILVTFVAKEVTLKHEIMRSITDNKKSIVGIVVIIIGFLFLFEKLGFISNAVSDVIFSWQMLLIAFGVISVVGHKRNYVGFVLILIGGFFLLTDIYIVPTAFRDVFWPILIIAFGLMIIFKHHKKPSQHSLMRDNSGVDEVNANSEFEDLSVFGGGKKNIRCSEFRSGSITSVFGGSEINLTLSKISPQGAVIDVFCMFGGTTIILPPDWIVKEEVISIFGGFSEDFVPAKPADNDAKVLHIKGLVIFGGGEIKRY